MKKFILALSILCLLMLLGCGKEYTIEYDLNGGVIEGDYITSFNKNSNIELPIPTKENYLFLGWEESDIIIDKIELRNYQLKAKWIEPFEYEYIKDSEIFEQVPENYLIYIMRDGCSWCSKIKNDVLRYIYKTKMPQYQNTIKLYVCNLNANGVRSDIFKDYNETDGDGEGFYVSKATSWNQLCIPWTPVLLEIYTENNIRKAKTLADGASLVVNNLKERIVASDLKIEDAIGYTINYNLNGGVINKDYVTLFYDWSYFELPIPEKEGYVFFGWYEEDKLITNIEKRNYNLIAHWEKQKEAELIKEDEIFSQTDNYYIIFIKNDDSKSQDIINYANKYNTWANYYNHDLIYLVDLNSCNTIFRTYKDENDVSQFYVDGVSKWDDLYIKKRYAMIHINNGISTLKADSFELIKEELLKVGFSF